MSYATTPDPQSAPLESHDFISQQRCPTMEWNTIDKFLEWQHDQSEFSSPESMITDMEQYYYQPQTALDTAAATWQYTKGQQASFNHIMPSTQNWSPMSATPNLVSPPPSEVMVDENEIYDMTSVLESTPLLPYTSMKSSESRGPQLPKIGRPRNTPVIDIDNEPSTTDIGTKAPGQARRRNQNREAQRAFRARQRQYIEQLAGENKDLVSKNVELEERCDVLTKSYEKVVALNVRLSKQLGVERRHESARVHVMGQTVSPWDSAECLNVD